jgi:gliding motility-associated-like protein
MQANGYLLLNVAGQSCSRYYYNSNTTTASAAQSAAQALGANLASIQNAAENQAIQTALQGAGFGGAVVWIGGTFAGSNHGPSDFTWYDGSPVNYTNWNPGEPNNNSGFPGVGENCLQLVVNSGFWNDLMCANSGLFPAPTGTSVIEVKLCPQLSVNGAPAQVCQGQQVNLAASTILGSTPYTYAWFIAPSSIPVSIGSGYTPTPTNGTVYVAGVQDAYGCSDSVQLSFNVTTCGSPPGCDVAAIRAALTGAGYYELNVQNQPCSMYFVNPTSQSSILSEAAAQQFGAHMVSFQSAAENQAVLDALYNSPYSPSTYTIWLGFSDAASEGNFIWLDGAPVTYTNWAPSEPNNLVPNCCSVPLFGCQSTDIRCSQGEDCVQMYGGGTWNDLGCDVSSISVIEVSLCPQLTIPRDTLICATAQFSLTASTILGSSPYTYNWNPGNSNANPYAVNPTNTTTYTVRSTDRWGCYTTDSMTISTQNCTTPVTTCDIQGIRTAFANAGYTELNGVAGQDCSLYFINGSSQSSSQAEQAARQLGAHLVVFNDAAENIAVVNALNAAGIISSVSAVWIGYTDVVTEGTYLTLDGTPLIYQNWAANEPNNNGQGATCCNFPDILGGCQSSRALQCAQGEDCVQIYSSGQWNDLPCDRTSRSVIEVNLCPEITASNDTSICGGNTVNLTASTLLGSTPYTYAWNPGAGNAATFSVTPATTTSYIVSVTDRWNCSTRDTVNVTVLGGATQTFTFNPSPACENAPVTLTYTGNSSVNANYTWNFDGATVVSGSGQGPYTLTWATAGGKNITLDVVDNGCISPQVSQPFTVNANPTADAGPDVTVCSGGTVQIGTTNTPGYTYQWQPVTSLSVGNISDPVFTSTNNTTAPIVTNYIVGVLQNGCTDFDTVTITQLQPAPTTISASGNTTFCVGQNVVLNADSVFANYAWSNSGNTSTITVGTSGTYTLTGTDANGCRFISNSITTTATPSPVLSLVNSTNESCFGYGDGSITVTTAIGTSPFNYVWGTTPPQNSATANNLSAGTYRVTVVDANQCADSSQYTITSPTPITVVPVSVNDVSCFGYADGTVSVSANGGTSPYSYAWSNGNSGSIASGLNAGSYDVTARDANNCSASATFPITEPQEIIINSLTFDSIRLGEQRQINLNITPSQPIYTYQWSPSYYLSCYDCYRPTFYGIRSTVYEVIVTDPATDCSVTAQININVIPEKVVFIPNVFTPNNDLQNDTWLPVVPNAVFYHIKVFNRIGEKVFDSYNDTEAWTGDYKGKASPVGVYTYLLNVTFIDGEKRDVKGTVTLLR